MDRGHRWLEQHLREVAHALSADRGDRDLRLVDDNEGDRDLDGGEPRDRLHRLRLEDIGQLHLHRNHHHTLVHNGRVDIWSLQVRGGHVDRDEVEKRAFESILVAHHQLGDRHLQLRRLWARGGVSARWRQRDAA
jgi:hypothetical protein